MVSQVFRATKIACEYLLVSLNAMIPIPILLYHSITDRATEGYLPFTLSPSMFRQHIDYLLSSDYHLLTITQLMGYRQQQNLPANPLVVTFDDGLMDFFTDALPILSELSIPATLYVTAGCVGKTSTWLQAEGEGDRPMMTWDHIRQVSEIGIELGAHSLTHPQLDVLNIGDMQREIVESKSQIEAQVGKLVNSFAYPYGYHDRRTLNIISEAGFQSACAVKNAISHDQDNPFALARLTVTRDVDLPGLKQMLDTSANNLVQSHTKPQTHLWRQYRQIRYWMQS